MQMGGQHGRTLTKHIKCSVELEKDLVGTKAYQLNRMYRLGFEICDGYVLTPEFFELYCAKNGIECQSENLAEQIEAGIFDVTLLCALKEIFDKLSRRTGAVIVRSSTTDEDSLEKSYAGIYKSIGYIKDSVSILIAVKEVWSSYYHKSADMYRGEVQNRAMPVLIQEMLNCEKSGILFTRNPVTNKKEFVVEVCLGNSEDITGNKIVSEHLTFTERTAGMGNTDILTCSEQKRLVLAASQLEQRLGFPCDLEWGIRKRKLYLFQARPICQKPMEDIYFIAPQEEECILLDRYARPACVCYLSLLDTWQDQVYLSYYQKRTGREDELRPLIFVYNRVYWNNRYQKKYFEDDGEHCLTKKIRFRRLIMTGDKNWYRRLPEYDKKIRQYKQRLTITNNYIELAELLKEVLDNFCLFIGIDHYRYLGIAQILYRKLGKCLDNLPISGGNNKAEVLRILGAKTNSSKTVQVNRELIRLTGIVRKDERLAALFRNEKEADILKCVRESHEFDAFRIEFEKFLSNHGHRGIDCDDLYYPHWKDDPKSLILLIRQFLWNQAEDGAEKAATSDGIKSRKLRILTELCGRYMRLREDQRYYFDKSWALIRDILLKVAGYFLEKQVLDDRQDIFHLTIGEIMDGLVFGQNFPPKESLGRRKSNYRRAGEITPPYILKDSECIAVQKEEMRKSYKVMGVSNGIAQGNVRIISDIFELGLLEKGEIGVVKTFHPSWTPILTIVSGLIMNYGNMLSHGSVVAREYGIPVVIFNGEADTVLNNGDLVSIDGGKGRLRVLNRNNGV